MTSFGQSVIFVIVVIAFSSSVFCGDEEKKQIEKLQNKIRVLLETCVQKNEECRSQDITIETIEKQNSCLKSIIFDLYIQNMRMRTQIPDGVKKYPPLRLSDLFITPTRIEYEDHCRRHTRRAKELKAESEAEEDKDRKRWLERRSREILNNLNRKTGRVQSDWVREGNFLRRLVLAMKEKRKMEFIEKQLLPFIKESGRQYLLYSPELKKQYQKFKEQK